MSMKQRARVAAKEALGDSARVDKLRGCLVVTRTAKVRLVAWRKKVQEAMARELPDWTASEANGNTIVFTLPKGKKP